jgi:DNA-binding response OmpR family regulator
LRYLFEEYAFDTDRHELHRGADVVSVAPQVFDLLDYLIRNRERVVSKDDLINAIWSASSKHFRARAFVSSDQWWKRRGPQAGQPPTTR